MNHSLRNEIEEIAILVPRASHYDLEAEKTLLRNIHAVLPPKVHNHRILILVSTPARYQNPVI